MDCHYYEDQGFLIHQRPYRETSRILYLFCHRFGLISLVYRGVNGRNNKIQPNFAQLYDVQFSGKNSLKKLNRLDLTDIKYSNIEAKKLLSLFYVHELLYRLLPPDIDFETLFKGYEQLLSALKQSDGTIRDIEIILRKFELTLLNCLGYGFDFTTSSQGDMINRTTIYTLDENGGFSPVENSNPSDNNIMTIKGEYLLRVSVLDFEEENTRSIAKKLLSKTLRNLLGGSRSLNSTRLFRG